MAVNKPMFVVGILLMIATAALFLFVEQDLGFAPIVLGIIGILMIGVSKYRPLKNIEKEKQKMNKEIIIGAIAALFIIALVIYISLMG